MFAHQFAHMFQLAKSLHKIDEEAIFELYFVESLYLVTSKLSKVNPKNCAISIDRTDFSHSFRGSSCRQSLSLSLLVCPMQNCQGSNSISDTTTEDLKTNTATSVPH